MVQNAVPGGDSKVVMPFLIVFTFVRHWINQVSCGGGESEAFAVGFLSSSNVSSSSILACFSLAALFMRIFNRVYKLYKIRPSPCNRNTGSQKGSEAGPSGTSTSVLGQMERRCVPLNFSFLCQW